MSAAEAREGVCRRVQLLWGNRTMQIASWLKRAALVMFAALALGARGDVDENGITPDYWYTFDGAIVKKGANGLSTIDKLTPATGDFVWTDTNEIHKAYSQNKSNPFGGDLYHGGGSFTIVTVVKPAKSTGTIWDNGGNSGTYTFRLMNNNANGVSLQLNGSGWPTELKDKRVLNLPLTDANTAYHVIILAYDRPNGKFTLSADGGEALELACDLSAEVDNGKYQFNAYSGGGGGGGDNKLFEYRLYKSLLTPDQRDMVVRTFANIFENIPMPVVNDRLVVSGTPSEISAVSPAYGLTNGITIGDSFLCSAPASWTNETGDVGADCVGYSLGYYQGEPYHVGTFEPGAPTAFTYTHPENELGTTLDWTWRMKYRVQIADADLGGHTEVTDGWKFVGETVTLTATPDEGYVFAAWQGEGVTDAEKGQASFEHVVDSPIVLKPLFLPEGGILVRTGESIHTAVANASAGDVIVLAPGVHHLDGQTINLTKKLTIRGATGNPADVILNGDASATNNKFHGFNVTADATIADLTVSNTLCNVSRQNGGGIILTKGTVTNCVVTDCHIDNAWSYGTGIYLGSKDATVADCLVTGCNMSKYGRGGGIFNKGGKVLRTRIVGNVATGSDGVRTYDAPDGLGAGLYQEDSTALAENCVISNNWMIKASGDGCVAGASVLGGEIRGSLIVGNRIDYGSASTVDTPSTAGLEVSGSSTRAVNCTVADNVAKGNNFVAGLNLRSGSVINCVVANNRNTAMSKDYDILGGGRGTWTNNRVRKATDITVGSGNLEADAVVFKDGTYELTGGSNAAGVGLVEGWMTGAADLTGKEWLRVDETSGETVVDAGALVWTPPPLRCLIRSSSAPVQFDSLSVTLTAEAVGETEGLVYYWDLDGDGKADRIGADLATIDYATATFGTLTFSVAATNAAGLGVSASPVTFKLVPSTVYVDRASANPVWPYNAPQTAANDFVEACKVAKEADGITVRVADGTYPISARTSIDTAVTIIGESREGTILDGQAKNGILKLTRSGASVKNITFYRGVSASESAADAGGGVCLQKGTTAENCEFVGCTAKNTGGCAGCGVGCDGGTVRDCIFRDTDLSGRSGVRIWGLGIKMDSGLVERCVFSDLKMGNIETGAAYDNFACGVYANGGTIRGCLFRRCLITQSSGGGGFAAAVTLNNATMVNCTVVSNTATANAAVSLIKYNQSNPSKVVNCVIWGNALTDGTVANCCGYEGYQSDLTYCCTAPALPGTTCISSDPCFSYPEKTDGRISAFSPCAKTGSYNATYLSAETLDLFGRGLVSRSGKVPMGCAVAPPGGTCIIVR